MSDTGIREGCVYACKLYTLDGVFEATATQSKDFVDRVVVTSNCGKYQLLTTVSWANHKIFSGDAVFYNC